MAEEIITSTNAETATDHEYNASEIQVLKGLEAVMISSAISFLPFVRFCVCFFKL